MEKIYGRVLASGVIGVICGIITIVTGVSVGVLLLISGGKLLSARKHMEE